jgi:hypothetical protein
MKQFFPLLILITISTFLCGCPYDSPYNIDEAPLQNIDEGLLGKWAAFIIKTDDAGKLKEEPVKIIFEKRTEMDYDIAITGYLDELRPYHVIANDSIRGTAYLSVVGGKQFLNAYIYGKVYLAEVIKDGPTISILPLSEYFTSKLIKNSKELRTAVAFHCRVKATPAHDPIFSLRKLQKVN